MVTACCHFLYPIVLNPWRESPGLTETDLADNHSFALPILDCILGHLWALCTSLYTILYWVLYMHIPVDQREAVMTRS